MIRVYFVLVTLLWACTAENRAGENAISAGESGVGFSSSPTGGWVFRGAHLGESLFDIWGRERAVLQDSTSKQLVITAPLEGPHDGLVKATYSFKNDALVLIRAEYTLTQPKAQESLFDSLVSHFNRHCGTASIDDGFAMWSGRDSLNRSFEILLVDEHKEMAIPYLSLIIRSHGN